MDHPQVVAVAPASPAALAGIVPGDEILTINGQRPRDVIQYRLLVDEPDVELEIRRGGLELSLPVPKTAGSPLGTLWRRRSWASSSRDRASAVAVNVT